MRPELGPRLLEAGFIIAAALVLYWLANRWILLRATNKAREGDPQWAGRAAIIYFTTPDCVPCKTMQRPALERLGDRLQDRLEIVEIDATAQPGLAKEWGVLSVPTTFVIDASGRSRYVNHGVATAEKLFRQVREILG